MACCAFGSLVTMIAMWATAFVRYHVLRQERPRDPTAWRLELPDSRPT